MGLTCVQGYFHGRTTNGSQTVTVTGLGAAPKMGIIWTYHQPSNAAISTTAFLFLGMFADDLSQASGNVIDSDNQSNQLTGRAHSGTKVIYTANSGGTLLQAAAITAVGVSGSDGTIALNWTTTDGSARRYQYIVWTGDDITGSTVHQFVTKASSGSDSITGVGFQPDGLIMMSVGSATAPDMTDSNFGQLSLGFSDLSSSYNVTVIGSDGPGTTECKTKADTSFLNVGWGGGSFVDLATISSADSDGFTLNYSAADASQRYCWVLAFKGPRVACGTFSTATSTGASTPVTGLADTPSGAVFLTGMRPSASGVQADARIAWGGSDGTNEGIAGYLAEDAQTTTDTDRFQSVTQGIQVYDHTQTKKTSGDVSFGSGTISVNYDVADGSNAYEVGYYVLMPKAASSPTGFPFQRYYLGRDCL